MIHSYSKVYQIGHKVIRDIFNDDVLIEEKIDGSQFSFGIIEGELRARSNNKQLILEAPDNMFKKAVDVIRELAPALHPGWTYRGEYLQKPKHNTLAYSRTPQNNIIGFDIMREGQEDYLSYDEKRAEFERIGLEIVPIIYQGKVESLEMFNEFLDRTSILGGQKIEGVVVKNYRFITDDKKVAMGKYVSDAFKEVHNKDWKERNPSRSDIVLQIIDQYQSEARWNKAIQHMRENGILDESPKDIGFLLQAVSMDILAECQDEIKDILFKHFWKTISRGVTNGLPQWYKQKLAEKAFETEMK
jgi:hypothetical protein